jgi:hypothetical protein
LREGGAVSVVLPTSGVDISAGEEFDIVYEWAKFLKDIQVDLDGFYGADYNALIAVVRSPDIQSEQTALLLALGANVATRDANGRQPLHHIFLPDLGYRIYYRTHIEENAFLVMKNALDNGIDALNSIDFRGRTPWDYAVRNGYTREYKKAAARSGASNFLNWNGPTDWQNWFVVEGTSQLSPSAQQPSGGSYGEIKQLLATSTTAITTKDKPYPRPFVIHRAGRRLRDTEHWLPQELEAARLARLQERDAFSRSDKSVYQTSTRTIDWDVFFRVASHLLWHNIYRRVELLMTVVKFLFWGVYIGLKIAWQFVWLWCLKLYLSGCFWRAKKAVFQHSG